MKVSDELLAQLTEGWPEWHVAVVRDLLDGKSVVVTLGRGYGRRSALERQRALVAELERLGYLEDMEVAVVDPADRGPLRGPRATQVVADEITGWRSDG